MIYDDRHHAGKVLAEELEAYTGQENAIVLGLPRGGVVLAYEVAVALNLPLDVTCPHKIGFPGQPEYAIGAVTETGEALLSERVDIPKAYLEDEIAARTAEAKAKLALYRHGMGPRILKGKTVIIVDDGLATGSTMKAAIHSVRAEKPLKIVAAIPVSPPGTLEEIAELADEVICPSAPPYFQAVGQFYRNFSQTTDEEVIELLKSR